MMLEDVLSPIKEPLRLYRDLSTIIMACLVLVLLLRRHRRELIYTAMRWMLGTFEAGLFPGVNYYLSWYPYL